MTQERVLRFLGEPAAPARPRCTSTPRRGAGPASRPISPRTGSKTSSRRSSSPRVARRGARERRRTDRVPRSRRCALSVRGVAGRLALGAALASIGYAAFALQPLARLRAAGSRQPPRATRRSASHGDDPQAAARRRAGARAEPALVLRARLSAISTSCSACSIAADPALAVMRRVARALSRPRDASSCGDGVARHRNPKIATLDGDDAASARGEIARDRRQRHARRRRTISTPSSRRSPTRSRRRDVRLPRRAGRTAALASALGAMGITEQFMPSALVANAVEPMTYCFGSTMAVRRERLRGDRRPRRARRPARRRSRAGQPRRRAGLSRRTCALRRDEHRQRTRPAALVEHELRWARTIRGVRFAELHGRDPDVSAAARAAASRRRAHANAGARAGRRRRSLAPCAARARAPNVSDEPPP